MEQQKLDRISELARKSRTAEGLTDAERAEQMALRQEYIESMKRSLRAQLDNIDVIDEPGAHPLKRRSCRGKRPHPTTSEVFFCD